MLSPNSSRTIAHMIFSRTSGKERTCIWSAYGSEISTIATSIWRCKQTRNLSRFLTWQMGSWHCCCRLLGASIINVSFPLVVLKLTNLTYMCVTTPPKFTLLFLDLHISRMHLYSPACMTRSMIICWNSLSIFFFFCRRLENCLLTGVIPTEISLLTKMEYLWACSCELSKLVI